MNAPRPAAGRDHSASQDDDVERGCFHPTPLAMDMPPSASSTCGSSSVDCALSRRTSLLMTEYEDFIAAMEDDEDKDSSAFTNSSQRAMDPPEENKKTALLAPDYARDVLDIKSRNRRMARDFGDIRSSLGRGKGHGGRCSSNPDGVHSPARSSLALRGRCSSNPDGNGNIGRNDFDGNPNSLLWDNDDPYPGSGRESDLAERSRLGRLALISTAVSALLAIVIGLVVTVFPSGGPQDGNFRLQLPALPDSSSSTSSSSSSSTSSSAIHAFDRSDGWLGRTYDESVDFCSSRDLGLCSYETICPFGPGGRPAPSASVVAKGVSWVAHAGSVSAQQSQDDGNDAYNSWVQVGPRDLCLEYDFMHGRKPSWGLAVDDDDDEGAEGLTEHVLCCPSASATLSSSDVSSSSTVTVSTSVAPETAHTAASKSSSLTSRNLDPEWYSSPTILYTYEDARALCSAEERFPCPYESYCPNGPHMPPISEPPLSMGGGGLEGTHASFWAPVVDERGHGMLRLDGDDDVCKVRYTDNGDVGTEDRVAFPETRSRHVMCCRLLGEKL